MEVYEIGLSCLVEHHITSLKVAIKETICRLGCQIFCEKMEIGLKFQLMEVQPRRFEKAVFEVIQVEEHAVSVELRLWITVAPVQSAGTSYLYVGKLAYGSL